MNGQHPQPELKPWSLAPDWDSVDEAGWESFPASDPPATAAADSADAAEPGELDEAERHTLHDALDHAQRAWATHARALELGVRPGRGDILASQARIVAALRGLFERCKLAAPENPWSGRLPRYADADEARRAAVAAEAEAAAAYERLAAQTERAAILGVVRNVLRVSQTQHLPALRG